MAKRCLTKDEIALARSVFGDMIDYDAVRITPDKFFPFHRKGVGMAPDGHIYMHGCYHDDYAAQDALIRSHFIHEMAHVWQFQQGIFKPVAEAIRLSLQNGFNYNAAYAYRLDGKKDLLDFNMEQQACIIQHYFLLKIEKTHENANENADEKIALLEKTLANFFKHRDGAKNQKPQGPKIA